MLKGEGTHLWKRQKPAFSVIECLIEIWVITETGSVTVQRVETGVKHLHSLENSDHWKRPSFVRQIAARGVANSYSVNDVTRNLQGVKRQQKGERGSVEEVLLHIIDTYFKFYILYNKYHVGNIDACLKARVLHVNGDMWGLEGLISSNVIYFSVAAE